MVNRVIGACPVYSFAITLPTVSAQEGTPPVPTATPTGTPVPETEEPPIATPTELHPLNC